VACGGLAASEVQDREQRAEARTGPRVPVVVARADLRAGAALTPGRLGLVRIPARYAPPDALPAPAEATGARLAVPLAAGAYVTGSTIAREGSAGRPGRPAAGERAIDVAVAGGSDLADAGPGTRVDILVTTEAGEGRGRSYLALEDVALLGLREAGSDATGPSAGGAATHATAVATLRVTLREAVLLTAAQSFAREIRLLVRPPGERRSPRGLAIYAGDL
ncbi:MAG: pilus assembly protein CpaB, partial [Thermoleophilaceae bacterium]|nr:pilus assembly protein CpaB [Thermoleophilaceae bacterium]